MWPLAITNNLVFNKFSILSSEDIDSENIESAYENLVRSTKEIAISALPKRSDKFKSKPSNSDTVLEARASLKSITQNYHQTPTQENKIQLIMAKKNLDDAYLEAEVDFINSKINILSMENISRKYHLAWKTVK